ncbi:unnamed protein product, partial [Linum tenue]
TVILYDLVCAGSVNPDYFDFHRYTTLEPYVDDLLNILYAHRIDRCAYVGHSVSAMIGLLASIRRPSSSPSSSSSAPPPGFRTTRTTTGATNRARSRRFSKRWRRITRRGCRDSRRWRWGRTCRRR